MGDGLSKSYQQLRHQILRETNEKVNCTQEGYQKTASQEAQEAIKEANQDNQKGSPPQQCEDSSCQP